MGRVHEQPGACIRRAADAVRDADALIVNAGAGMGVDSGLPDFRGPEGFWRAYPDLRDRGLDFYDMASPRTFIEDPTLAWRFYGHRQALYRDTRPHDGFARILDWCRKKAAGYFVFTSNVDGHFQKAGFDPQRIFECHGNIYAMQCQAPCSNELWETGAPVDPDGDLPACPTCGGPARPNVLMFGDYHWISDHAEAQHARYRAWLREVAGQRVAILELGAGLAVPTVRLESEALKQQLGATLVRINPRDAEGPDGTLQIALGAAEAIERIDRLQAKPGD